MFQRIQQYDLLEDSGTLYRPRAYGDLRPDGMWDGWLVFFPIGGSPAISSGHETTQSTLADLRLWASGLSAVYLVGAFERALRIAEQPPVLSRLAAAEYEALEEAEDRETAAEIDELAARTDRVAAETARAEAAQIRRERIGAEAALAATEEASAMLDAAVHEEMAREARAAAADAGRRKRTAASTASRVSKPKKGARNRK